ncbi:MAG TPA: DUF1513 domain-containing protein [Gammaproteobacteria bacterium]|nr:DUF1513 domain-containing protein [Gammaproteobacteria bacterium]
MPLNRRNFLKALSVSLTGNALLACTHKQFFNPDEDILLSGGSVSDGTETQDALIVLNLARQEKRLIETPFLPHEIIIDPGDKYRVLCFKKNAGNACEVNLQTQEVTRLFHTENDHLFSGHACFSKEGKKLYTVESAGDKIQGSVVIRDGKTFQRITTFPSLGLKPHDCQITDDNILLISNTGKSESSFHQPSLIAIDLATEKLTERISLKNKNLDCGHFTKTENGNIVIASAPVAEKEDDKGGVSIRRHGDKITTMTEPELVIQRMTGEALGIAVDQQRDVAAITHPDANLITFWSIKNNKIIKAFGMENPRGICLTLDKKYFVISFADRPAMVKIPTTDLTPLKDSMVQPTLASGEHLLNWSQSLREIMPTRVYG